MPETLPISPRILNRLPAQTRHGIEQLAEDIGANSYLRLATTHAALSLERLPNSKDAVAQQVDAKQFSGLRRAEAELTSLLAALSDKLAWTELLTIRRYAEYSRLRRIILGQYQVPRHRADADRYYTFLSILLLYVHSRAQSEESIERTPAYHAFRLFHIEERIDELFPASLEGGLSVALEYEFPKPSGRLTSIIDILQEELHVESIATHFKIPHTASPPPVRYVCYRYTTRWTPRRASKSTITKSYLELYPPHGERKAFSFRHEYLDTHEVPRITDGFIVKLVQTFYFIGGSLRGDGTTSMGIKVMAIPTSERSTWHDHDFISGLFLSNDSDLNPIAGRLLLVRAREIEEPALRQLCDRIPESALIKDIKQISANSSKSRPSDEKQFILALQNEGQDGKLKTVVNAYSRK
jgi:hypothetical protein